MTFITLTNESGDAVVVNPQYIVSMHRSYGDRTTRIVTTCGEVRAIETQRQILALIEER